MWCLSLQEFSQVCLPPWIKWRTLLSLESLHYLTSVLAHWMLVSRQICSCWLNSSWSVRSSRQWVKKTTTVLAWESLVLNKSLIWISTWGYFSVANCVGKYPNSSWLIICSYDHQGIDNYIYFPTQLTINKFSWTIVIHFCHFVLDSAC